MGRVASDLVLHSSSITRTVTHHPKPPQIRSRRPLRPSPDRIGAHNDTGAPSIKTEGKVYWHTAVSLDTLPPRPRNVRTVIPRSAAGISIPEYLRRTPHPKLPNKLPPLRGERPTPAPPARGPGPNGPASPRRGPAGTPPLPVRAPPRPHPRLQVVLTVPPDSSLRCAGRQRSLIRGRSE